MVYRVIKFEMIDGKIFNVWEEMPGIVAKQVGNTTKFYHEDSNREANFPHWQQLTTSLAGFTNLHKADETEYLPYVATVIEDLPSSVAGKFPPQEYQGCKLLAQKCNGYMEFFHEPSGKTLRIAMNSNYYKPAI